MMHGSSCNLACTLPLQVQRLLGQGSYGKVFLVKRTSDGKLYALKEGNVGRMSQLERMDAMNEVHSQFCEQGVYVVHYFSRKLILFSCRYDSSPR